MKNKLGSKYKIGKVYGLLSPKGFFDAWSLGKWHSFCLTFNNVRNLALVYLDGTLIQNGTIFERFHSIENGNLRLFQDDEKVEEVSFDIQTEVTDLNIWNNSKSNSYIQNWNDCNILEVGDFLKWSNIEFMEDVTSYEIDLEANICAKPEKFQGYMKPKTLSQTKAL